jgi:hypothetical protein
MKNLLRIRRLCDAPASLQHLNVEEAQLREGTSGLLKRRSCGVLVPQA